MVILISASIEPEWSYQPEARNSRTFPKMLFDYIGLAICNSSTMRFCSMLKRYSGC